MISTFTSASFASSPDTSIVAGYGAAWPTVPVPGTKIGVGSDVVLDATEPHHRVVAERGDVDRPAVGADRDPVGAGQTLLGRPAAGGVADVGDAALPGQRAGRRIAIEAARPRCRWREAT